ncbi:hypothetical protein GO988_06865 [Hymenobacter sp. HMF4947]|uniref:DUF4136 domain-containing protein n=1 Tax=Hymenobacter ginkgonis TaxID=2682976 RepID=A0A7K1TCX2_9BACT|nr:hypothetical protein [Hymenobacter ginkgonis]MVN76041.1 hypothetical protein [Hymenobacter ginkgonis]
MRQLLTWVLLAAALASCTSLTFVRAGFKPAALQDVAFVTPQSVVAISPLNQPMVVEESATNLSVQMLHKLMVRHRFQLRLRDEITLPDSLFQQGRSEIYRAIDGIERHQQLAGGAALPVLDYLLGAHGQRYAMMVAGRGILWLPVRTKWQVPVGYDPNLLLSQTLKQTVIGVKSSLYLFIYDSQQHAIVYYARTPPTEQRNPLNEASLEEQFSKMVGKDFPVPHLP